MLPLAVAEAYDAVGGTDILFVAAPDGPASRLVPQAGYRLEAIRASALMRVGPVGKAAALLRLAPGFLRARRILRAHGTRLVVGSGGYASGSVMMAARSLGVRTAIIEPNAVPGLANRLLAPIVHRGYFTFPGAASLLPPGRRLVTGTPVRGSVARCLLDPPRRPPWRGRAPRVLVTGGSRGDDFLASRVPPLIARLAALGAPCEVRHQVSGLDPTGVREAYRARGLDAEVVPFLADLTAAYHWADLAVVRAGATTLAELALARLPSLLVPLADAAGSHQIDNAATFAASGAALWCEETAWNETELARRLAAILLDVGTWLAMHDAALQQARPDAAADIVRDCEAVMSDRW
jgi:UDP-N-acetylglucosamine--N-acetylmuramyl-(pentapeptide) pyrophosphoryl-undecaprenol N-acetylglucosamine transferase